MNAEQEWLDWRAGGIGASEVAVAAGLVVYGQTAWDLWAAKTGKVMAVPPTERMRFGVLLEPVIAAEFERETGLCVLGEQTWCNHPDHPHHKATVDGFVAESPSSALDDVLGVFEAKTGQARWDDLPDAYTCQVQWQMHVTGLPRAWVAYLRAGYDFSIHEVERDDELIALLVKRVDEFWFEHVLADVAPEPTGQSDVAAVFPVSTATSVELDADAQAWWNRAVVLRRVVAETQDELDNCTAHLKASLGDADTGTIAGVPVCTWRSYDKKTIDAKRLEAEWPEIAEACRVVKSVRTFLLKEPS